MPTDAVFEATLSQPFLLRPLVTCFLLHLLLLFHPNRLAKIAELFVYDNFSRIPAEEVKAGDICAFSGIPDIKIGETVAQREKPVALPTIKVGFQFQN